MYLWIYFHIYLYYLNSNFSARIKPKKSSLCVVQILSLRGKDWMYRMITRLLKKSRLFSFIEIEKHHFGTHYLNGWSNWTFQQVWVYTARRKHGSGRSTRADLAAFHISVTLSVSVVCQSRGSGAQVSLVPAMCGAKCWRGLVLSIADPNVITWPMFL